MGNLSSITISIKIDLEKVNIIFYDKKGKPVEYEGIETISMDTVIDNTQASFIRGSAINPFSVDLNMENGNQIINADGQYFKEITILKPESLVPENIKKKVIIGGIEGTFAGDEVEKTAQLDYSDYTPAYNSDEFSAFKTAENENKIIRVMYEPTVFDTEKYLEYYKCIFSNGTYDLIKIDNISVPSKNEYAIEADKDTVLTKVIIPKHPNLKPEYIKKNIDIQGVTGSFIGNSYEYTASALDFSKGNSELLPVEDYLFNKIIIPPPNNLIASNIKEGVSIAGIVGTYKLNGLPKLKAPSSISNLNSLTSNNTSGYLTVTSPTSNGYFATECQLYAEQETPGENGETIINDVLVATKKITSGYTFTFYASDWLVDSWPKTSTLKAQLLGNQFNTSDKFVNSSLTVPMENITQDGIGLTQIIKNIQNVNLSNSLPDKVYWGQQLSTTVTPKSGYYLPKKINVSNDPESTIFPITGTGVTTYNNKTGALSIKYNRINVEPMTQYLDYINIEIIGSDKPWLEDFVTDSITLNESQLTIPRPDLAATRADIKLNNTLIKSINYPIHSIKTLTNRGSSYTSVTTSTNNTITTYTCKNNGNYYGYCVYRYTFTCSQPTEAKIIYSQYNYTTYNCGYISKLDTAFTVGYGTESSSNCLFYGSNSSSTTTAQTTKTITIPAGTHTIDFKWRGYYPYTSYYFTFAVDFPESQGASVKVDLLDIEQLKPSGDYVLSITAEANGYIGTDPVTMNYTRIATSVENETLIDESASIDGETFITNYATVNEETLVYDT